MKIRGPYQPEIRMESPHKENDNLWRWIVIDGFGKKFAAGYHTDHVTAMAEAKDKLSQVRKFEGWD